MTSCQMRLKSVIYSLFRESSSRGTTDVKRTGKTAFSFRFLLVALVAFLAAGLIWSLFLRVQETQRTVPGDRQTRKVAVEAAALEHGPIELRRTFSGALEATAKFVVAPKVSGRVEQLAVDLADRVRRGQVVARLDNDEYVQAVAQSEADLAVARANRSEAGSSLDIANRELKRVETLRKRGVASESQLDAARSRQLAARSRLEVARAQVTKAEASLETARIRLGYTAVSADWTGGNDQRLVAERFVDEGETVSANAPLLSIVELDPITGVMFVTERDYASISPGQPASLVTDAYPGESFSGRVTRVSPVFNPGSRQARVELSIDNPSGRLKPGMFVRVAVVLERVEDAVVVPESALTRREDRTGVFLVDEAGETVSWQAVQVGIREGGRVQLKDDSLVGRVVTLGQQMLDDGSSVRIVEGHLGGAMGADRK